MKQGVIHDIPKDVNVGAMDVNVVSVSFRGQEADAVVSFAPKGGPPMMTMNYTMERKGDEWHIKKRANGDLQKHAGQAHGSVTAAARPGATAPPIPGRDAATAADIRSPRLPGSIGSGTHCPRSSVSRQHQK